MYVGRNTRTGVGHTARYTWNGCTQRCQEYGLGVCVPGAGTWRPEYIHTSFAERFNSPTTPTYSCDSDVTRPFQTLLRVVPSHRLRNTHIMAVVASNAAPSGVEVAVAKAPAPAYAVASQQGGSSSSGAGRAPLYVEFFSKNCGVVVVCMRTFCELPQSGPRTKLVIPSLPV